MKQSAWFDRLVPSIVFLLGAGLASGSTGPGEEALNFMLGLRDKQGAPNELLEGTVLSHHTGAIRRSAISQRLALLGRYLRNNRYELKVSSEKRDGDLAAVTINAVSSQDPLEVDVFGLGLRNRGADGWAVAPVPGSFDNVDLGFDQALEERADALELWMGKERLLKLRALEDEVLEDLRMRMKKAEPAALEAAVSPRQLVKAFSEACQKGDLPAAMVLLGKFEGDLSEEERRLQRVVSLGLQGLDSRGYWHFLTRSDVVRVVVQEEGGDDLDAEVSLLVFDPRRGRPVSLIRFVLLYVGKRWTIELPSGLRLSNESRETFRRALLRDQNYDEDDALRKKFEEEFEEQNAPLRSATITAAAKEIEKILREGSLAEFLRFAHRSPELAEPERRAAYRYLGAFWNQFHQDAKAASDGKLLDVIEHEDAGALVFRIVSTAQDAHLELNPLILMRDKQGWSIAPGVTTGGNFANLDKDSQEQQAEVHRRFESQREDLTKKAIANLRSRFVKAAPVEGGVVRAEEAGELVRKFRSLIRKGNLMELLSCGALLDSSDGMWEALNAMSYEYRGAKRSAVLDQQVHVQSGKNWAAVTLRVDSGQGSSPSYPMYLLVATGEGPRIVVDVGLRLATNKGREVLNERVWERIDLFLEEEESALVRLLFERHVARSKTDLDAWMKTNTMDQGR